MSKAIEKAYKAYPLTKDNRLNHERNAKRLGFQQGYEQADKMLEFSNKLIDEVAEFAKDSVDQEGWATSLLMGLSRATSVAIRGLEKASDNSDSSLMKHYVTHVLPLCDLVTQRHETKVEEAMANMDAN